MRSVFLCVLFISGLSACKQSAKGKNGVTYKSASEYNDYIVNRQTALMKNVFAFGKYVDVNQDSAEIVLNKSVKEATITIEEIKGMPPFKRDSSLRDAAVASFSFYKRLFEKDYRDILAIRKKVQENITQEDVDEANRIVENISKEEEKVDKAFHEAQREYASKNNMRLMENQVQKDMENELNEMKEKKEKNREN